MVFFGASVLFLFLLFFYSFHSFFFLSSFDLLDLTMLAFGVSGALA